VPLLSGWADLDQRENAADIGAHHPILIDPKSRIDPVLARFLGRSRFAWLAEGTRQAYAHDYRLFFSFLWQRGRYWHEADPDDLLDWEAWRRRAQQPGRGIGGSKWQRELAALRLVYEWAEKEQRTERSPVLVHQVGLRGGTVTVADQAPRDVRSADVKWVTPRTYRLWRDVGLLGYDAAGQPDPSWRGRNDGRNAAFTDLLFSSGLRLREGGCLLTLEVPEAAGGHGYYEGTVAGAVAKRRQRMFYASAAALRRVAAYVATTRPDAVPLSRKSLRRGAVCNPRFRSWALGRDLERFDAFAGEHRVEGVGELAVAVADQEAQLIGPLPEIGDEIAGQLRRPGRGWMRGDAQDVDVSVAGIQDEEHVDTLEGYAIDVEEIARQKRVGVGTQEAAPGLVAGSSWRGRHAVSTQDAADRPGGNPVPQAAQLALDSLISPRRVLGGQSHDQGRQVIADRWPARRSGLAPFAGDQTAMPPQDGAGSDHPADTQVLGQDPDERR
jgi:site-specific recombinase XerD